MPNNFANLKDPELRALLFTMVENLEESAASYGLTPEELAALATARTRFGNAVQSVELAEASLRSAYAEKRSEREESVTLVSNLSKKIYANPEVSNAMLADIGLAARGTTGQRHTPKTPTRFFAEPKVSGEVVFSWERNGNTASAVFTLQQWKDDQWITIAAVTQTRFKMRGFKPGTTETFRVFAWLNNAQSAPSTAFTIYCEAAMAGMEAA